MYDSIALNEVYQKISKLDEDCKEISQSLDPLENGYEVGTTHPVQEDMNGGILFDAIFSKRKVKKAKNKTFAELKKAIRENDMTTFARAIWFENPNIDKKDESNFSLMDWAVGYNRPIAVKLLLRKNISPNDHHPKVAAPLLIALESDKTFLGEHACAILLIRAGADLFQADNSGKNALMKIIKNDMSDVIDEIPSYTIDRKTLLGENIPVLLYGAKYAGNEVIKNLLKWRFNIKDKTPKQETILHMLSARQNKEEFIKKAIEEGVNVNATDIFGNTALHYAAQNGQYKNVEILLKAGASPLISNLKQELAKDKINASTYSNTAVSKTISLLSDAMCHAYQQMLEKLKYQEPIKIASQKSSIDLKEKANQHHLE